MLPLRIAALDTVFAQGSLDNVEILCWEDGIADARVYNGVAGLDTSKVSCALTRDQGCMVHSEGPVVLVLAYLAPEDVLISFACLGVLGKVIATKGNTTIFFWSFTQENAEHWLQRVLLAKFVDFLKLLHETFELVIRAHWCKSDDSSESIVLDARCLVSLKNFQSLNTWRSFTLLKAKWQFSEETIDVA